MRILIKSEYIEHEVNIMDIFGRPDAYQTMKFTECHFIHLWIIRPLEQT